MNAIYLYGTIGDDWWDDESMPAAKFVKLLNGFGGEPVDIFVNSPGGSVFDGSAIYTAIQRYEGHVRAFIDGLAASAASYCILSADEVLISPSATMMIHDPFMYAQGNAEELRSAADSLDKLAETIRSIYAAKSDMDEEEIKNLMSAETWFTAAEAIACGLADGYCEEKAVSNSYNERLMAQFKHVPNGLSAATKPTCNDETTIAREGTGEQAPEAKKPAFTVVNGKVYQIGEKEC